MIGKIYLFEVKLLTLEEIKKRQDEYRFGDRIPTAHDCVDLLAQLEMAIDQRQDETMRANAAESQLEYAMEDIKFLKESRKSL